MEAIQRNLPSAAHTERSELPIARTDTVLCDRAHGVFALSSGPPAQGAGQPASTIFLSTVNQHAPVLKKHLSNLAAGQGSWKKLRTVFSGIFEMASETIRTAYGAAQMPESSGTVMIADSGVATVAHVGLTRGYIVKSGKIVRLTSDFRDEVDNEERTMLAMAPSSHGRQAMGQREPLHVDGVTFRLVSGSTVILVSEGVSGIIRGRELLAINHQMPDLAGVAAATVRMARTRQIVADCSAVVVRVP